MKDKIKIAYLLTPVEFGGSEKVNLNFLKNVDRNEFNICPIVLVRPWQKANIFIQELENEGYALSKVPVATRSRSKGRDYFRVIRSLKILHFILKKGFFDLVHTHGYFADIIGIPVARILGIPHISTCHGFISTDNKLIIYNMLDRIILRFSNRILAVSDSIKHDLTKIGIKQYRITVIQNALEGSPDKELFPKKRREKREKLNIREEEFLVGYVGRLSYEKGLKYLIEAASTLNELGIPIKVLIIGKGPQKDELRSLVKDKGIEHKFLFVGFQSDIEDWMPALDVFILPSLTEGTPMALLEAMSFGVPVIASRVGDVPKIIVNGENGLLVEARDSKGLAQAIKKLFHDYFLRKRMAENAEILITEKYNVHNWCRKIEKLYMTLCEQKQR